VTNEDYKTLFERFKDVPCVLFVVDPPYLSTDTSTYHSDKYWHLRDYLDVLKVLVGSRYVYFTSNKSSLPELGRWLGDNAGIGNPFDGAELKTRTNSVRR
jgi:site-specific DNA-adenine methylase